MFIYCSRACCDVKRNFYIKKILKLLNFFTDFNAHTLKIKVDILKHQYPIFIFLSIPFFNIKVEVIAYNHGIYHGRLYFIQHF